jgi:predicted dehydrogenase
MSISENNEVAMAKIKIALIGTGGISQIYRIPALKKFDEVDLVALCDIDETKAGFIADKYQVPKVYYDIQNLLKKEELDGIIICTPNGFHYPMALACLERSIPTFVEKPLALNESLARRLVEKALEKKTPLLVGMNNRFRNDVVLIKNFLQDNEIGIPFYIKAGWLKQWNRIPQQNWMTDPKMAGGGVVMDLGLPLIDLALWLLNKPRIRNVRTFSYNVALKKEVEDSALVVLETVDKITISVEVSWRLHLEKDMHYFHIFGEKGSAFLNPLRLNKEIHDNLINVTPKPVQNKTDLFKQTYENELKNFLKVIQGEEEAGSPGEDAIYMMHVLDAIYESEKGDCQVDLMD